MPLQNIYRPKKLDELYGNSALVKSLKLALERKNQEDIPSAFFFHGDAGCGKTTMAHILKEHFEVSDQHFRYYDAANTRGIDTVRTIREIASFGGKMMFVLDEVHQLTGPAQEGLLLPLQDPIPNKYFVLCTTEPGKIKLTIKRRCFNGEVKALSFREMGKFLDDIIESELGEDRLDDQVYQEIVKHSNGSPGLALNLLDSVIDVLDKKEALEILSQWTTESDSRHIGRAVHNNRWREVQQILSTTENSQVERMRQGIMGYLRKVMLDQKNNDNVTGEAAAKLAIFLEVTPDQHINGLASACYMATHLSEPNDIPF